MGEMQIDSNPGFPPVYDRKTMRTITDYRTRITDKDKVLFQELDFFLNKFNIDQKKAIVSDNKKILCIAGAGSGKTSVLTKRIEFLIKYKGVNPRKILAITFTRKAREEMKQRLMRLNTNTHVETFNSFSEKVLRAYDNKIYGRPTKMIGYQNKVMLIMASLDSLGLTLENAIDIYFKTHQRINKEFETLSNSFMNDCFFILDYFKIKNKEIYDFSREVEPENKQSAELIYKVCSYLKQQMDLMGLRDYTDQILDTLKFFKAHPGLIPEYEHILVDEYQDVNDSQTELIDLLGSKNLFCVGDPRQSIFGWRGSSIKYIFGFKDRYEDSEIISLTKNYRSSNHIVGLINGAVKHMNLPDLEHNFETANKMFLKRFDSEDEEHNFVLESILNPGVPRQDVFVLARTNRQLLSLSRKLNQRQIPHILKTDEINRPVFERAGHVTLATIHSIKGLEAKKVFVIGCTEQNFPCKASDHPVIEMIKIEEYDKEEEEKRLFYVALSRARKHLYLSYHGKKHTSFINDEMLKILNHEEKNQKNLEDFSDDDSEEDETIEEEVEETESGYFGKFDRAVDGSGYSNDFNPYAGDDWEG